MYLFSTHMTGVRNVYVALNLIQLLVSRKAFGYLILYFDFTISMVFVNFFTSN